MPQIVPTNAVVLSLQGLHLYHYGMSNCSQRVRVVLEEKNLFWTGHHLDLAKNEHATPAYQGINPNGLVPTLVHDGKVIIESIDIITYLDERFPDPPLGLASGADGERLRTHLERAGGVQGALKLLSHEFLFKPARLRRARQIARFSKEHRNAALVEFHRRFAADEFEKDEIAAALARMHAEFAVLENALEKSTWLAGEVFSLADVAWTVNVHRMSLLRFPFETYPRLSGWYERVRRRPSFQKALVAYEPRAVRWAFRGYTWLRGLLGTGPGGDFGDAGQTS